MDAQPAISHSPRRTGQATIARFRPARASSPSPASDEVRPGLIGRSPRWALIALGVLLAATAGAYLWNLSASGYGNSFYAAAVEAGSKSWKAMFYGSLDSSNFITVDKPPASLWVMDLSARIFGFSTWSVMVPGVAEGVAAVGLLYAAVRRVAGPAAGLVAGVVLAATPVAALMFRFDNPDALLVLLLVASAYCVTRAIEKAGTRWLVAAGALIGLAFLAKMMQAFTVVPFFGVAYLVAAPTRLRHRIAQLLASLAAMVVAGGWWVAIVALVPAADRPFIDGSPDNSILNLIFVYNGFGRITGNGEGGNFSGTAGILRLFNDEMGGQASWLIPAALVGIVAVLIGRRRRPRTDRIRAAAILWGGWLLVTGAVFSYGRGVIHTYYTVALAPAIAAMVALGAQQLWVARERIWARALAAVAVAATAAWAWDLLDRTPSWHPWLRWAVAISAVAAGTGMLGYPIVRRGGRWAAGLAAALVAVACLSGPVAYAADTLATGHTGSIPVAGPASAGGFGGGGFGGGGFGGGAPGAGGGRSGGFGGQSGKTAPPSGASTAGSGGIAPTGTSTTGSASKGAGFSGLATGTSGSAAPSSTGGSGGFGGGASGGGGASTSTALVQALEKDASSYKWVAAVDGSQSAATIELSSGGEPVMAIGGFSGQGGNLSLAAFEAYVAKGEIHYYIAGGSGGGGALGGRGGSSSIATWVAAHYQAETIGGQTVYDLTASKYDSTDVGTQD
jgi:4-amino-4-deoxy-L-arabinose transferase-like glycosyltransferase